MTLIKEFTKHMTQEQADTWYDSHDGIAPLFRDIVCHFETKIEKHTKRIVKLENELRLLLYPESVISQPEQKK